ncbi:MAG: tRNA (adenosine(37)-N6)-threonylcarbamoyltransferase complex dimerization subunit type 1 TsaB [Chitinispirillaceae bacterium]|nr:tRNA (adenosine(37)-N6)-threonylcarbamoyltransferase complex dimerization subunit type 1 TsaB [Chitinispirillaceae bacterium]
MSLVLGIDTSSTDLSVGLYREGRPLASFCRFIGNSHAEQIAAAIGSLLSINDIDPATLNRAAIAVGPGSFTGLRIGIAFLKGFCMGRDVRVLPVSSLLILAYAARCHHGRVIAAIDARNDSVYWASFNASGGRIERLCDDTVAPQELFTATLTSDDMVVTDTIGYKKSSVFSLLNGRCPVLPIENHPLHRGLLCAAAGAAALDDHSRWSDAVAIHPNYLRRSMPEERLRKKAVS